MRHHDMELPDAGTLRLLIVALAVATGIAIASPCRGADLKTAAANFKESCASCHGDDGKGNGPKAAQLKAKAANYTDCNEMKKYDDAYLFNIIKGGGAAVKKSKDMPPFEDVYDQDEMKELVGYIRSFCAK